MVRMSAPSSHGHGGDAHLGRRIYARLPISSSLFFPSQRHDTDTDVFCCQYSHLPASGVRRSYAWRGRGATRRRCRRSASCPFRISIMSSLLFSHIFTSFHLGSSFWMLVFLPTTFRDSSRLDPCPLCSHSPLCSSFLYRPSGERR
jgi:hypothetical protein